ncbi:MAG: hypothetical protein ACRD2A_25140 [Vicinamibacterales bacterium]
MILPADTDPNTRLVASVVVMAIVLGLTVLGLRAIDRILEPGDPRRRFASQLVLYGGTALLIALLLLLRQ